MARSRLRLSADLQQRICALIRAGSYPHIAAQAVGVSCSQFDKWLRLGRGPKCLKIYRNFALAVAEAEALARLKAETQVHQDNPLNWLKHGPGKPQSTKPGWTNPARGTTTHDKPADILQIPEVNELIFHICELLSAYPDARRALVDELAKRSLSN